MLQGNSMALKPRVFIASSSEHLEVAYALQEGLEHACEVTVWTQGVFDLSRYSLESLIEALESSDFGIFVFTPDDVVTIREKTQEAARDNVLFELGLFIGRLGRERCYIVIPRGAEESLRLPTDLLGITPALYEPNRQDGNVVAAVGPASTKILRAIAKVKPSNPSPPSAAAAAAATVEYSEADILAILESWFGSRSVTENYRVFHFSQVDSELNLPSGSAKQYLRQAASRYGYPVRHEGDETVLFAERKVPQRARPREW
jgi:hypothetical protein